MSKCSICKKRKLPGNGSFFRVPNDDRRDKWSRICGIDFARFALVCIDHFTPSSYVKTQRSAFLLPNAVPIKTDNISGDESSQNVVFKNQHEDFTQNSVNCNKIVMPPQLQEEPIMEIPAMLPQLNEVPLMEISDTKSLSCAGSTQTNTRLCGLVEAAELSDEFRLNCFYCSEAFPLEKWTHFADHLRENHFEIEDEFKTCKYVSEEHDYTSRDLTKCAPEESAHETDAINANSQSFLVDPLEPTNLSCSLKTVKVEEEELEELEGEEECQLVSIEIVQQNPAEITFEYTPRHIVDSLLDSMKDYPVLWQFDEEPFNQDFYEAVEDLCKIINDKWSMNMNNLKMRRSINRILRFYCYLYPNDNIENIDQYTCYYDKCASFLPTSVNEIAYARCSHCYKCYRCDFDLKNHLLDEFLYLKWPYKCAQCKECFIECDEYEFHKSLLHYDEIFRCEPCNKTFFRRNIYNKHVSDKHVKEAKYKCDLCEKVFKNRGYLRNHRIIHGEKKHKCHLCTKSYVDKAKLTLHLKWHRRQFDFMCEHCGVKLFTQSALKVHLNKHTQEKVTCNICNLKLRKSSLSRHLELLHVAYEGTIEQTLKGRHVNYRRFSKSSPFLQRRTYSEKKYNCKICKISLNYDLVIEHNEEFHPHLPMWPCKMCATDFTLKRHLKRHYRRRHKLELIQINQLVEEDEDLDVVLGSDNEHSEKIAKTSGPKCKKNYLIKPNLETVIKSDSLVNELYFEEDKNHSPKIHDEIIMNSHDYIVTQDEFFTEFLEDP